MDECTDHKAPLIGDYGRWGILPHVRSKHKISSKSKTYYFVYN
jgi:hypothetical protein